MFAMGLACSSGLMERTTKAIGNSIRQKARAPSGMRKEMCTEVSLGMTWPTATASTLIATGQGIRASLLTIYRKATVKKNGLMELNMLVATKME